MGFYNNNAYKLLFSLCFMDVRGRIGYSVELAGAVPPKYASWNLPSEGVVMANVYYSRDRGTHANFEHAEKVGSFEIAGVDKMSAEEFIEKIREGIQIIQDCGDDKAISLSKKLREFY
jgi:hypothetical protein